MSLCLNFSYDKEANLCFLCLKVPKQCFSPVKFSYWRHCKRVNSKSLFLSDLKFSFHLFNLGILILFPLNHAFTILPELKQVFMIQAYLCRVLTWSATLFFPLNQSVTVLYGLNWAAKVHRYLGQTLIKALLHFCQVIRVKFYFQIICFNLSLLIFLQNI